MFNPDVVRTEIFDEIDGVHGDARVAYDPTSDGGWRVLVSGGESPILGVYIKWRRDSPAGELILNDHFERGYGDLQWLPVGGVRPLAWYAFAHNPETGVTTGYGVDTGAAAIANWNISPGGVSLALDLRCGARGVLLGDRELHAATIRTLSSGPGESAFSFAQRFCRALCPSPRLPKFPVYGGNDWYYAYGNNSRESILRDARLIRECSPDTENAPFMVIDAGWFPARGCAGGPYSQGNDRFPDMPGLASAIREIDVRPGIWIRPLLTETAPDTWKLPVSHPIHALEKGAVLDPSVPDVLEHVKADIRRLVDWGYELVKHDFTTFDLTGRWGFDMVSDAALIARDSGWAFSDRSKTTAEIVKNLYSAIRGAAGDALLIGCNTIGHLGAGCFELQRTGDDTSGREWDRTRKMGVNTLAFRMPQHDAFFAVDADCVGLTNQIPWRLNAQWLDVLARSGTPLFVSADPDAVGPEQRAALTRAFARAARPHPVAEPLDWLATPTPTRWRIDNEIVAFDWNE